MAKLNNFEELERDMFLYGCCAIDKNGKRVNVTSLRVAKNGDVFKISKDKKTLKKVDYKIIQKSYG